MFRRLVPALVCAFWLLPAAASFARPPGAMQTISKIAEAYNAKNYAVAYELALPLAEKNDPQAALVLGLMAARGDGQPKDLRLAADWWGKAAAAGNAEACFNLGQLHFKGVLGSQDLTKARELWAKGARQMQGDCLYGLGLMQMNGAGGPQDMPAAVRSYRAAARLGHPLAEYELGLAYQNGKGVKQNAKQAKDWFAKAANKGVFEADEAMEELENPGGRPDGKKPSVRTDKKTPTRERQRAGTAAPPAAPATRSRPAGLE